MSPLEQKEPRRGSEPKPLSARVVRGVLFSVIRKLVAGPIFVLLVPFTLHRVGAAGYGTWAIFGTLINISWLLDMGLGATVTKYVAEHNGKSDLRQIQRVLDTSVALYLFVASAVLGFLWFCAHAIVQQLFRGPSAMAAPQVLALWPMLLAIVAADLLVRPFTSLINGLQRMDLTNVVASLAAFGSALLTVLFLCAGAGVGGLLLAALMTSLLGLVATVVVARWLLPSVTPNPLRCDLITLKRLGSFSLALYAGHGMTAIQGQIEKLYLARFVGVVPVGWYNMAGEAASKIRRMPDLLLGPVMAAASELDASGERGKLWQLHFRAHKYLALTAVPLVVFAVFNAKALVTLWVGQGLVLIALPFAVLVIGNFFPQVGAPTYFILVGRGILRPGVYCAVLAGVLNIVLSLIFIKLWGFRGAVWGTVLPMIISTVYYFIAAQQYFETSFYRLLGRAYLKPLLCSFTSAGAMYAVAPFGRFGWRGLVFGAIVYAVVYLSGLLLSRFFDSFDFAKAQSHLPLVRLARRSTLGILAWGAENRP